MVVRAEIFVKGVIQGVGFRPFIYRLARQHALTGLVANTPAGVRILVFGPEQAVDLFSAAIIAKPPPLARIHDLGVEKIAISDNEVPADFRIAGSLEGGPEIGPVTPDTDLCENCLAELFNSENRRYLYPFINCTDCGPRYSLIDQMPYDRGQTGMKIFVMCPECLAEYRDPADRRFHAQATCCPVCGPKVFLTDGVGKILTGPEPLRTAGRLLQSGKIVAIKGIGGFHLAVDAKNEPAVAELRRRKGRPDKPLAVMAVNIDTLATFAEVSGDEKIQLTDTRKPIVLLRKKISFPLAENVAPANGYIGAMLPYTPLHHLLFSHFPETVLVMTSGNLSGSPIVKDNDEALKKLRGIADYFLLHDRPIVTRLDDSVIRVSEGKTQILRRARAWVPTRISLHRDVGHTLALGAMLKNTVCLTNGKEAFLSQHIGDFDNLDTQFQQPVIIEHLKKLLRIEPDLLVHDLHPDYPSAQYARTQRKIPAVGVQHHHAHIVSCMAEHNLGGPVIGLALDGNGYGPDNTVWGGEVLLADYDTFERAAHLTPVHLPGGEAAIREPWRMAASHLFDALGEGFQDNDLSVIRRHAEPLVTLAEMMHKNINSPLTSSCGRLFDAVAALLDIRYVVSYEGQAAVELEMLAGDSVDAGCYPLTIERKEKAPWLLATAPLIRGIVDDLGKNARPAVISARFHKTLAALFSEVCEQLKEETGIKRVALSGGVFQNMVLLRLLTANLEKQGFTVYSHHRVPANDGGLALGQAVIGRALYRK